MLALVFASGQDFGTGVFTPRLFYTRCLKFMRMTVASVSPLPSNDWD
jgi:hypothetical protein